MNRILPKGFQFSQGSLQDFVDCPRRFQLHYIWEFSWPAVQAEPALENELFLQQGAFFHHLIHQYLLGISEERLAGMVDSFAESGSQPNLELARWWKNFLAWRGWERDSTLYSEISMSAPLGEYRLVGKYDLIMISDQGEITIFDWKTSRKRPTSFWLKERLQSKVYPCLLSVAGAHLVRGESIQPEKVMMIYWFADFPLQPERLAYNSTLFTADKEYLSNLVREIINLGKDDFPMTSYVERCAFCVYRSFCNRGVRAGSFEEEETTMVSEMSADVALDFEQIGEIEY